MAQLFNSMLVFTQRRSGLNQSVGLEGCHGWTGAHQEGPFKGWQRGKAESKDTLSFLEEEQGREYIKETNHTQILVT